MPEVSVQINEREYTVVCEEGEEDHLIRLGRYVDKHVKERAKSVGHIRPLGEAHLLAMVCLEIADKLSDANELAHATKDAVSDSVLEQSSETLNRAAVSAERMVDRLDEVLRSHDNKS
ncbi:MAG: cell division protein ZapA [Pseudomonadota bacterium]|nr:cell division protein ZapA [Pseudomonadota bacterium]